MVKLRPKDISVTGSEFLKLIIIFIYMSRILFGFRLYE